MKSISPRESMEYSIELLEAVKTFSETTEMTLEQSLDMTIKIIKLHLKQPQLELVTSDEH
jgi:hypothetical protein